MGLSGCSQTKKAMKYYKQAREEGQRNNYEEALRDIEKSLDKSPDYMDAILLAADLYREAGMIDSALAKYEMAFKYNAPYYVNFYYGKLLFMDEQYEEAQKPLKAYLQSPQANSRYVPEINKMLESASFAAKAKKNPQPFKPENLGPKVNTDQMDYFPSISANGNKLVFTHRNMEGEDKDEDFWYSERDSAGAPWSDSQPLKGYLNTPANEGAQSITSDGEIIFFAACNRPQGFGSCDIYASFYQGDGMWSEAVNMGKNINTNRWESQPSISSDGRTLYFVRGKDDNSKKMDIYYSELGENGRWQKAQKIPGEVNTEFQDVSPFIHFDNQTLYFSSNGHPGMGDQDFFVSRRRPDGSFGEPENLGYPINSSNEDFSLIVAPDGKTGYFAREGGKDGVGMLDLYSFELPPEVQAIKIAYVKGKVIDKKTREPISTELEFSDLQNENQQVRDESGKDGKYFTVLPGNSDYALSIQEPGYLFYSKNFTLTGDNAETAYVLNVELIPIEAGTKVKLENVFFAFDSYELKPESYVELKKVVEFLKANPSVRISIEGHTDSKGDAAYNKELSLNRAKAVYEYIAQQGIAKDRLEYEGYGAEQPVATNETEKGRALNRRTEMKILNK